MYWIFAYDNLSEGIKSLEYSYALFKSAKAFNKIKILYLSQNFRLYIKIIIKKIFYCFIFIEKNNLNKDK